MEKLFIRILNRSLLAGCILLLGSAVLVALLAVFNFLESRNPNIDNSELVVTYVPLPPVLPSAPTSNAEDNLTGRFSQEDVKLMRIATPGCLALGKFASTITDKRLDFHGGGLTICERAQLETAKSFGDKAVNYLTQFSNYTQQLSNDPHVATNYGSLSDDQAKTAVDGIVGDFAAKFRAAIEAQNSKNSDARADAATHRILSVTLLAAAGTAFVTFLFIAFLIVFLRIEKHLEIMSAQRPMNAPTT